VALAATLWLKRGQNASRASWQPAQAILGPKKGYLQGLNGDVCLATSLSGWADEGQRWAEKTL
jgi:hypothetical protein